MLPLRCFNRREPSAFPRNSFVLVSEALVITYVAVAPTESTTALYQVLYKMAETLHLAKSIPSKALLKHSTQTLAIYISQTLEG